MLVGTGLWSCSPPESGNEKQEEEGYAQSLNLYLSKETFTGWETVVDSQLSQDELQATSRYKAYIEGRNHGGLDELRAVIKEFPKHEYETYVVKANMTSAEFYDRGTKLQREGYKRMSLQVYIDGSGTARHQAVWLKPITAPVAPSGE